MDIHLGIDAPALGGVDLRLQPGHELLGLIHQHEAAHLAATAGTRLARGREKLKAIFEGEYYEHCI